jgi:hypothetical protein
MAGPHADPFLWLDTDRAFFSDPGHACDIGRDHPGFRPALTSF